MENYILYVYYCSYYCLLLFLVFHVFLRNLCVFVFVFLIFFLFFFCLFFLFKLNCCWAFLMRHIKFIVAKVSERFCYKKQKQKKKYTVCVNYALKPSETRNTFAKITDFLKLYAIFFSHFFWFFAIKSLQRMQQKKKKKKEKNCSFSIIVSLFYNDKRCHKCQQKKI